MMSLIRMLAALLLFSSSPALAAPSIYALQPEASIVGFETDFGPDKITGTMPVTRADLTLDFKSVANSQIAVTLDASAAKASFPFAAQAMKGPKVLDAREYPTIAFQSTRVSATTDGGARVEGNLTIRGVSRPIVMLARIARQDGFVTSDNSHLTIRLTGAVQRSDYGATGWADMVSDQVRLDILARIASVE
jgi:polyisoprenoid-binding protein YceI